MGIHNKRKGMALLVVMGIAVVLLVLGMSYIKSFSHTQVTSTFQQDRLQADYFAKGIQNIALFKIRKYPDYFIRAYKLKFRKNAAGVDDPEPKYFTNFLYDRSDFQATNGGILQDYDRTKLERPSNIVGYSTNIDILAAKDFNDTSIEIKVTVTTNDNGREVVTPYILTVAANQVVR